MGRGNIVAMLSPVTWESRPSPSPVSGALSSLETLSIFHDCHAHLTQVYSQVVINESLFFLTWKFLAV